MPLHFGPGPTYTELSRLRKNRYQAEGPALVLAASRAVEALDDEERVEALQVLDDASLQLGALDPSWFDFSVAVFEARLKWLYANSRAFVQDIKDAWDASPAGQALG